jgi:hypothetical protein
MLDDPGIRVGTRTLGGIVEVSWTWKPISARTPFHWSKRQKQNASFISDFERGRRLLCVRLGAVDDDDNPVDSYALRNWGPR